MRVGRNNPCYCGSGKKYKRCCLSAHQSRDTAYATDHPETDVEILDRAIPPLVIQEAMAEADGWSFDDFQRLVDDLMRKHPALLAFVVSVIAVMPTTIREHSLLTVVAVVRMFERHYGPHFDTITQNDITHFSHRNSNLIRDAATGIGHKTGDVVQPFVLKFVSDVGFDFEKDQAFQERDALGLLLTLKTVIDVLDRAYGACRQRSNFASAAQ